MPDAVPTVADLVGLVLERDDAPENVAARAGWDALESALAQGAGGLPAGRTRRTLEMLRGILAIPVPEVLVTGWRRYEDLLEHADPTRHPPDQQEEVPLADHEFTTTWTPEIDLLVDGAPIATLAFEVELALAVDGAVLVIQDGRILELAAGSVRSSGAVRFEGRTLASRESAEVPLPGRIRFPEGVPIRPEPVRAPA